MSEIFSRPLVTLTRQLVGLHEINELALWLSDSDVTTMAEGIKTQKHNKAKCVTRYAGSF